FSSTFKTSRGRSPSTTTRSTFLAAFADQLFRRRFQELDSAIRETKQSRAAQVGTRFSFRRHGRGVVAAAPRSVRKTPLLRPPLFCEYPMFSGSLRIME